MWRERAEGGTGEEEAKPERKKKWGKFNQQEWQNVLPLFAVLLIDDDKKLSKLFVEA